MIEGVLQLLAFVYFYCKNQNNSIIIINFTFLVSRTQEISRQGNPPFKNNQTKSPPKKGEFNY